MTRKVCVITGTRAEYGLLKWVMEDVQKAPDLKLQIIATGMHLSKEFGLTYKEIENDGFFIDRKVEIQLSSDAPLGISKSMGLCVMGISEALQELSPDLVVILGDRFEIFSAATAAMVARIPIAHLHGGEATEGAFDEAIRHSITKMAHLHFVAADEYRQRVIQLGENPSRVFLVGGLGVDSIKRTNLMSKKDLEESLGIEFGSKSLLVTFHPVTLENETAESQMTEVLKALTEMQDTQLIFTLPNADPGGRILKEMVENFAYQHSNAKVFTSLGHLRYLSCLALVDGLLGNSSSGICEAPSFCKGVINIGDRQKGRIKGKNIIDCEPNYDDITTALKKLYSFEFQKSIEEIVNPYGEGGASQKIVEILRGWPLENLLKKSFFNIPITIHG